MAYTSSSTSSAKAWTQKSSESIISVEEKECITRLNILVKEYNEQKNKLSKLKNELALILKNSPNDKNRIQKKKEKIEIAAEKLLDLDSLFSEMYKDYLILKEIGDEGRYGSTPLSMAIQAVSQVVEIPMSMLLHFAHERYSTAFGILILAGQVAGVMARPTQARDDVFTAAHKLDKEKSQSSAFTPNSEESTFGEYDHAALHPETSAADNPFLTAQQEFVNLTSSNSKVNFTCVQNPDANCSQSLIEAWYNSTGNLTAQEQIEEAIMQNASSLINEAQKEQRNVTIPFDANTNSISVADIISEIVSSRKPTNIYREISETRIGNNCDTSYPAEKMDEYARLSEYHYRRNASFIPTGWKVDGEIANLLAEKTGFTFLNQTNDDGSLDQVLYSDNGLIVVPFVKENTTEGGKKEICISFGGTTSGRYKGEITDRLKDVQSLWGQLTGNVGMFLNTRPAIYQDARNLTKELIKQYDNDPNVTVSITGHSIGGALCTYAAGVAGSAEKPIACRGFSVPQLNRKLKQEIAGRVNNTRQAKKLLSDVKNVVVKGDPIPRAHNKIDNSSFVGTRYVLEPKGNFTNKGAFWRHSKFYKVTEQYKNEAKNFTDNTTCTTEPDSDIDLSVPIAASLAAAGTIGLIYAGAGVAGYANYLKKRKKYRQINFQRAMEEGEAQPLLPSSSNQNTSSTNIIEDSSGASASGEDGLTSNQNHEWILLETIHEVSEKETETEGIAEETPSLVSETSSIEEIDSNDWLSRMNDTVFESGPLEANAKLYLRAKSLLEQSNILNNQMISIQVDECLLAINKIFSLLNSEKCSAQKISHMHVEISSSLLELSMQLSMQQAPQQVLISTQEATTTRDPKEILCELYPIVSGLHRLSSILQNKPIFELVEKYQLEMTRIFGQLNDDADPADNIYCILIEMTAMLCNYTLELLQQAQALELAFECDQLESVFSQLSAILVNDVEVATSQNHFIQSSSPIANEFDLTSFNSENWGDDIN